MKSSIKVAASGFLAAALLLYAGSGFGREALARHLNETDFEAKQAEQVKAQVKAEATGSGFSFDKGTTGIKLGADTERIAITGVNGSIELKQGSGTQIEVHTRVVVDHASRTEAEAIAARSGIKVQKGKELSIKTYGEAASSRYNISIHLTVTLPKVVKAGLQAELTNGNVLLSKVTAGGPITLAADNGNITVKESGSDLVLHTDNGVVTIAGVQKSAAASVVNGNIDANKVTGPLDIRTVNGNLTVKNAYSSIKAESVAGNIHIESSKVGGHWDVSNTAGNVSLAWPEQADVQVEASATFGKPETEFPLTVKGGRVSGTLGAGTYRIEASSLAGLSLKISN
ncbi:hypothetical protein R70723_04205 [Paenibacillus sp. FSL R7-0273]|uniref:DUF4097 family beta strand repeat-containing protein n=1 Tax=Paenibacillus sp. FSL R7-0273 TaxID=1536772 RepID=UPI0004F62489|nr:DUF4097 family beta strand repeat-containing protein [Paenibacillus sp. FSL R7-0273]AIQ45187.1 hypothetical protein R70723_04205 [Paenibacillus sp. FSL R7-0273]OMF85705.1 hypothetical protein BK144_27470 [Paenibacillus sp. FSL R7-0273]